MSLRLKARSRPQAEVASVRYRAAGLWDGVATVSKGSIEVLARAESEALPFFP